MRLFSLHSLGFLLVAAATSAAQPVTIEHRPVTCAVAEKFPQLKARLVPRDNVANARIVFQGENTQEWYSVAMRSQGADFAGVLPKPMKSLRAFRYYIDVTDKGAGSNRTADYTASVVESAATCKGRLMAASLSSASILIQGPAGVAALPAGFGSSGVVAAGSMAGAAGSGSGAAGGAGAGGAAAGGGGLSTGAIIGIAAGVGGAAAVGMAVAGGGESEPGGSVAGQWVGTWRDNDPTPSCGTLAFSTTLNLAQSGTSLSGAMTNLLTTVPPASSTGCASTGTNFSGPVASGSASGTSVQFVATLTSVSPTRIFTFAGSVSGTTAGSVLTGTYVTTIAGFPQIAVRGTLSATKQ